MSSATTGRIGEVVYVRGGAQAGAKGDEDELSEFFRASGAEHKQWWQPQQQPQQQQWQQHGCHGCHGCHGPMPPCPVHGAAAAPMAGAATLSDAQVQQLSAGWYWAGYYAGLEAARLQQQQQQQQPKQRSASAKPKKKSA
eukprot:m51a1_g14361 hypothetical protein (140) ;mRNA; f:212936-214350